MAAAGRRPARGGRRSRISSGIPKGKKYAVDEIRGLQTRAVNWKGNALFAKEFIKIAKSYGINPGVLAEATLRRSGARSQDPQRKIAILKVLGAKK